MCRNVFKCLWFWKSSDKCKKNLHLNSVFPKMSRFFRNVGYLFKGTTCNLLSSSIFMICFNLSWGALVSG